MRDWRSIDERRVVTIGLPRSGQRRSAHGLQGGERGEGRRRGEPGTGFFDAGLYPACSLHGAMNRVGKDNSIWRCLVEGCNSGLELIA